MSTQIEKSQNEGTPRQEVTYQPNTHEELKRKLRGFGIQVVASNYNNVRKKLVKVKDKVPLLEKKGSVYKLQCKECEASYTGQSGQCLKTRLYRHKLAEKNKDTDHYPLVEHCQIKGHNIDWSNVTVHAVEPNQTKRCLIESLYIARNQTAVNKQPGLVHSNIWEWALEDCTFSKKSMKLSMV